MNIVNILQVASPETSHLFLPSCRTSEDATLKSHSIGWWILEFLGKLALEPASLGTLACVFSTTLKSAAEHAVTHCSLGIVGQTVATKPHLSGSWWGNFRVSLGGIGACQGTSDIDDD